MSQSRTDLPSLLLLNLYMVHPPNSGAKVVLYNRIVELSKYFRVTFCCLRENATDPEGAVALERFCEVVLVDAEIPGLRTRTLVRNPSAMEFSPKLSAWLEHPTTTRLLEREFDVVEIHSACWHHANIRRVRGLHVLVALNDERAYFRERAAAAWNLDGVRAGAWAGLDALLVARQERQAIASADAVVSLAPLTADEAKRQYGARPVLSNWGGVDCDYYAADVAPNDRNSAPLLVYVAAFFVEAAVEGAAAFAREVLPKLRDEFPGTRLLLVGDNRENPTIERLAREHEAVDVAGLVSDVRPYLRAADAVVVPLRHGSGIRFKIMEALAAGKAVVSTEKGAEGLGLEHERDLLIAPDVAQMKPLVSRLLGDAAARQALERRALARARLSFDRVTEHEKLADWYHALLRRQSGTRQAR